MRLIAPALAVLLALAVAVAVSARHAAETVTVTGAAAVVGKGHPAADSSGVVVWLEAEGPDRPRVEPLRARPKIVQRGKQFEPHLSIVTVGTSVDFPNLDPFFHNVFSLFDGKRFDLGLYEAGTSRTVTFTRPGVCYVF